MSPEVTACGWCGAPIHDWNADGKLHKWGACVDLVEAWGRELSFLQGRRRSGQQEARLRELRQLLPVASA